MGSVYSRNALEDGEARPTLSARQASQPYMPIRHVVISRLPLSTASFWALFYIYIYFPPLSLFLWLMLGREYIGRVALEGGAGGDCQFDVP